MKIKWWKSPVKWHQTKVLLLKAFARLVSVHFGVTRDLQNVGHWVAARQPPNNRHQLAAYLYPGSGTDLYFPAPAQPEDLRMEAVSARRAGFSGSLVEGMQRLLDARRRLLDAR